jgi:hypothetical protein
MLSPSQQAAYTMGRSLLVIDGWARMTDAPIEFERAMLIDFAVQYPRSLGELVPTLPGIVRAHGLEQGDLGDLFATRRLSTLRETFSTTAGLLLGRQLLDEATRDQESSGTLLVITEAGRAAAQSLCTPLAFGVRAMAEAICVAWRRRNTNDLRRALRENLPDESLNAADLMTPIHLDGDE